LKSTIEKKYKIEKKLGRPKSGKFILCSIEEQYKSKKNYESLGQDSQCLIKEK
jgi:hypothetical protein